MKTTVGVLLHDDYPDLARRVLTPLLPLWDGGRVALRVGANAVSQATVDFLQEKGLYRNDTWVAPNLGKYPMMRRMFYANDARPVDTPFFMWFDDDSYIRPGVDPAGFLDRAEALMDRGFDLAGQRMTSGVLLPGQPEWIGDQPWYAGGSYVAGQRVGFFAGGWWTARTMTLRLHDYPWPALHHNGGDVMLGVLAREQGWQTANWHADVAINADAAGVNHKAVRRGLHTLPIGARS